MRGSGRFLAAVLVLAVVVDMLGLAAVPQPRPDARLVHDQTSAGWTEVSPPASPPAMAGALMAYSSRANRFVMFGGWTGPSALNTTWSYDPGNRTWDPLHPAVPPVSRGDGMFVYDARADLFVLFGGWHEEPNGTYVRLNDTWVFSLSTDTWTERHPGHAPSSRSDSEVAYDRADDAVLVVGGFDGSEYLGDVWSYNPTVDAWAPRPSSVEPSRRADGRMVYIGGQGRFLLFGGNDYSGPNFSFHHLSDTWAYNWSANAWTLLPEVIGPEARDYPILALDPSAGEVLLTSGFGNGTSLSDLWGFNLTENTWSDLTPTVSPPARFAAAGGFDVADNLLVVFGGANDTSLRSDTWHYAYGPAPGSVASETGTAAWIVGAVVAAGVLAGVGLGLRERRRLRSDRGGPPPAGPGRER